MPMDMYETADNIVVKATVPGVKPEDIEVTITGDLLTIKGESKTEEKTEKRNYLRQERRYGSFCRQVSLAGRRRRPKACRPPSRTAS